MKKIWIILGSGALAAFAGCVSIRQEVPIQYPAPVEEKGRSPLDKCPPHVFPHRLILAQALMGSPLLREGGQNAGNQRDFDYWWGFISPQLNADNTPSYSLKPVIDWDTETASFIPLGIDTTCRRIKPYGEGMVTNCYTVTVLLYSYTEGGDCQSPVNYPVFIYVHAKTNLPFEMQYFYPTPTPPAEPAATPGPSSAPATAPTPEGGDE